VNLILDRQAVTELIQHELNVDRLSAELNHLLNDDQHRESMKRNYSELRTVLGGPGASNRTAIAMLKIIGSLPKQPTDTE
jgi:lipid-A-disaccharide synthase